MNTDDLIDSLAQKLSPVRPWVAGGVLAGFGAAGAVVSTLLMLLWLGLRPDLAEAAATGPFWIKFFYTAGLSALGVLAVDRLARPGGTGRLRLLAMGAVIALLALAALAEWIATPDPEKPRLVIGATIEVCTERIFLLSLPLLAALLLAMRRLAPTRLGLAGFGAGLAAGASGALVYSFHCDESAMTFVAIWYTLGIAATGLAGLLLGPVLLRWR